MVITLIKAGSASFYYTGKMSDDQAQEWLEMDATVWSVVVNPWILVQQVTPR